MFIVFAHLHHACNVVEQLRWLKLTVSFFTQMEDGEASGQILIVRCVTGDQIGCGLDDGFMNIGGFDAVIKLNM
ncbi:hypothetical protein D3C80_1918470 [compost metagenome]